jgi:hypothetical protein
MPLDNIGSSRDTVRGSFPLIVKEMNNFGRFLVNTLVKKGKERGLDASGVSLQTITFEAKMFGSKYQFLLWMPKHYEAMDKGSKPHWMPEAPILKWMRAKGIKAKVSDLSKRKTKSLKNKTVKKSFKRMTQEKAQKSLAFLIRRSIAKKGTIKRFKYKGSEFYSDVINDKAFEAWLNKLRVAAKKDIIVKLDFKR